MLSLLEACIDGNDDAMRKHIPDILPKMLSMVSSPLAAPYICKMVVSLKKCVFYDDEEILGKCRATSQHYDSGAN